MAAKPWMCRLPGCVNRSNDPADPYRAVPANTCAGCNRPRYLPHAIIGGVLLVLALLGVGLVWLTGMPARQYADRYRIALRGNRQIDAPERQELTQLAAKYHLSATDIARIEEKENARAGLIAPSSTPEVTTIATPTIAGSTTSQPAPAQATLVALLHSIYSDHVKSPAEAAAWQEAVRAAALAPTQAAQLEEQIKTRWQRAQPYFERGLTAIQQARAQTAVEAFQRALSEDGDNAWILANLSAAYLQLGRVEDAEASGARALTYDATNWLAHYNLGSAYARRGRKENAIDALQQALQCAAADRTQPVSRDYLLAQMRGDAALASLRQEARWQQLLAHN